MCLTLCMNPNRSDGRLNLSMHTNRSYGCLTMFCNYPNRSDMMCLTLCMYPKTCACIPTGLMGASP